MPREPVPKTRAGGRWTEARYRQFIRSLIRKGSVRWPPISDTLKAAQVGKQINKKTGRLAMHFECAQCKGHFPRKDVSVDHILPIVDPDFGFEDWDTFIERAYCESDNLQVLCREQCHAEKTEMEREAAKIRRTLENNNE